MRVQIHDLSPGQTYALKFRATNGAGGSSEWSQVQRFTTTNDTVAPADVQNLQFFNNDDSYVATWDKVTLNADSTPLHDFRFYHVKITAGAQSVDFYTVSEHFQFTKQQNAVAFGEFQTAVTVAVSAVDMTYNESTPVTAFLDPAQPPVPATPTVGNYIGLLLVTFNNKDNTGASMPGNIVYYEVHISTTTGFTPTNTTLVGTLTPGLPQYIASGLTYGATYYVKLVAVNSIQKKSNPSAQGSGSPQRITGLDIQDGQISAEQINWVATGIPGGNAYYSTTKPTGGTYTTNDIWYDTDNAYTPSRWNGADWVTANDVGFIVGTKILAGTLTANAIGANQIITASANIANAVIDDAHISNVSAGKLTAGTVSADVVIAGRFATALTGARREMNNVGFQAWDSSNNQTINLDGVNNLLVGTFATALTGRRMNLAGNSSLGEIVFIPASYTGISPNNKWAYILSQTEGDGTTEDIQLGLANATRWPSAGGLWNRINLNSQGWTNIQSEKIDHTYSNTGNFIVRQSSDFGNSTAAKLLIDNSGFYFYDISGVARFGLQEGTTLQLVRKSGESFAIYDYNPSGISAARMYMDDTAGVYWNWYGTNARLIFIPNDVATASAAFQMVNNAGYGVTFRFGENSDHTNQHLSIGDAAQSGIYQAVWGGLYTNQSSQAGKTEIKEANLKARESLRGVKPKTFRRKGGKSLTGEDLPPEPLELGLIAEEVPEEVRTYHDGKLIGIATSSLDTMLLAYIQEVDDDLDLVKTDLTSIKAQLTQLIQKINLITKGKE